jgi:hypothetical protein
MQVYKIVQIVNGLMVVTEPTNIFAWAQSNGREVSWPKRILHLRPELQTQPRVQGLCGPMYDGLSPDGLPVVRYEDGASNDILSR